MIHDPSVLLLDILCISTLTSIIIPFLLLALPSSLDRLLSKRWNWPYHYYYIVPTIIYFSYCLPLSSHGACIGTCQVSFLCLQGWTFPFRFAPDHQPSGSLYLRRPQFWPHLTATLLTAARAIVYCVVDDSHSLSFLFLSLTLLSCFISHTFVPFPNCLWDIGTPLVLPTKSRSVNLRSADNPTPSRKWIAWPCILVGSAARVERQDNCTHVICASWILRCRLYH